MILTATQQVALTLSVKDRKGNAALIDGVPEWAVDRPDVVTLTVAEDGKSAGAVATGAPGTAQVSVTADADMGEGQKPIVGLLSIEVVAAEASVVTLDAGTPEEQPE